MDHTPTPYQRSYFVDKNDYARMSPSWKYERKIEERLIIRGPGIIGDGNCNPIAKCFYEEDAEFIVRACNAHDDLINCLEQYVDGYRSAKLFDKSVKALAKAKTVNDKDA